MLRWDRQRQQPGVERRLQHIERLPALLIVGRGRRSDDLDGEAVRPLLHVALGVVELCAADQLHVASNPLQVLLI
jgi:hypothetical protein